MLLRRMAAQPTWLVYAGAWAFIGALSWTTAAVLLVRGAGLSPPQLWLAISAYWATTVVRSLTAAPYRTWLNLSIPDSSSRATVLSITNLADSAGQWGGGPALGWVGTRWAVRTALAVGALCLLPAVVLLGRAARRKRGGAGLVTPGAATSRG